MAALAVIVQVPGLSHFFGSRPLMPHGWVIGLGCAMAFAVVAVLMTRWGAPAWERLRVITRRYELFT